MIGAGLFNPQASVAYLSFRQDSPNDIPPVKTSVPSSARALWIMLLTLGTTFVKRQEARGSFFLLPRDGPQHLPGGGEEGLSVDCLAGAACLKGDAVSDPLWHFPK
jgi:hypothetical protein